MQWWPSSAPLDYSMCFLRLCLQSTAPPRLSPGFSDPPNSSQPQRVSLGVRWGKSSVCSQTQEESPFLSLSHRKPSETGIPYSWFPSMGSLRVGDDWAISLSLFTFMHWRRKWQPTPVFLPRESHGQRSLVGCRLWGRTESDTTEAT